MRNLSLPSNLPSEFSGIRIVDITDDLPINPKNSWAALAGVRSPEELTVIALHHDAWPKRNRSAVSDLEFASEIAQDHIDNTSYDATGEGGMPYHIWIRNGVVYQCNDLTVRTYGVGNHNAYTVHVCVSGEYYRTDALTDADRNALYVAILAVKKALPSITIIRDHKAFAGNKTDCPGYDGNKVRADIQALENRIEYAQSIGNRKAVAFDIANQILYLANLAQGKGPSGEAVEPGKIEWGQNMLLELRPFLKERGLL